MRRPSPKRRTFSRTPSCGIATGYRSPRPARPAKRASSRDPQARPRRAHSGSTSTSQTVALDPACRRTHARGGARSSAAIVPNERSPSIERIRSFPCGTARCRRRRSRAARRPRSVRRDGPERARRAGPRRRGTAAQLLLDGDASGSSPAAPSSTTSRRRRQGDEQRRDRLRARAPRRSRRRPIVARAEGRGCPRCPTARAVDGVVAERHAASARGPVERQRAPALRAARTGGSAERSRSQA